MTARNDGLSTNIANKQCLLLPTMSGQDYLQNCKHILFTNIVFMCELFAHDGAIYFLDLQWALHFKYIFIYNVL